ncbi:hypothetical protein GTA08_BOTSDO04304 [Neofusicoccum parvum]|uniref:Uncharacterized protein n=1 Tax=Neofusicoccum parvum TaxID=310453 RepID=A0ACB5S7D7_9PEZI|nr:hypothetical protein GTA08_BOTSDO04304 [Neofusicoccum parvum]
MPFRRPPRSGLIRRSQFDVPALELREALATKLAAIAQRGAQVDEPEPPSDSEGPGAEDSDLEPDVPSDDEAEDDESLASSSGASSPETSPVPSPTTAAPTAAALSSTAALSSSTDFSSTLSTALGPAPTSSFVPTGKDEDSDSEEDPSASAGTFEPSSTRASATAEAELSTGAVTASLTAGTNGAQQSGEVWVMSGGPPPPPPSGISQSTEHLLIAAGSIGATLLLVIVIFGVYTMRKKGLTFRDLVQMSRRGRGRPDRTADIAKPSIHHMPAYASDDKERMSLPQPPQNSVLRFDSVSSRGPDGQRDYLGVARFRTVDSWVGQQAGRIPSTQFRNQPHLSYRQSTSTNGGLGQVDEGQPGWQQEYIANNSVPDVPSVPSQYKQAGPQTHQRQPTAYSDATVFRQHPGTEVQIPRGSLVPSEVLDAHMIPSAL